MTKPWHDEAEAKWKVLSKAIKRLKDETALLHRARKGGALLGDLGALWAEVDKAHHETRAAMADYERVIDKAAIIEGESAAAAARGALH